MDHLQWYDYLRMVNALLALVAMYRLGLMFIERRKQDFEADRAPESRLDDFFWVLSATMFTVVVAMIEQIHANAGFRSASLLTFAICVVCIKAARGRKTPIANL